MVGESSSRKTPTANEPLFSLLRRVLDIIGRTGLLTDCLSFLVYKRRNPSGVRDACMCVLYEGCRFVEKHPQGPSLSLCSLCYARSVGDFSLFYGSVYGTVQYVAV